MIPYTTGTVYRGSVSLGRLQVAPTPAYKCTAYCVQCTIYKVKFTVYILQCLVYSIQCSV